MSKNNKILLIGTFFLIGLAAIFYYYREQEKKFNWYTHSYKEEGPKAQEPYALKYFFNYLQTLREEGDFHRVDSTIDRNLRPYIDSNIVDVNYLIVGDMAHLDSISEATVFEFVEKGNQFFVFNEMPPVEIMDRVNGQECVLYWPEYTWDTDYHFIEYDSTVTSNFEHPDLHRDKDFVFNHRYKGHLESHPWYFMDDDVFCADNTRLTPLGRVQDHVNFFRVKYGEGYFYFHTNPKMYTNYYLVNEEGLEYAQRTLAHLSDGPIVYDNKTWKGEGYDHPGYGDSYRKNEGPLKYLLSQESLRWSLYVLFGAVALMLAFIFQRKQRIIPVINPKENSSIEYVETITELYYMQGGQGQVMAHLTEQFLQFVRKRYRLSTTDLTTEFDAQLAKVSGLSTKHIASLMSIQRRGTYLPNVTSEMLIEYYSSLNHFYEHCK